MILNDSRLKREATVLASLNHSNISHIYGLEDAEGKKALPLELVESVTNVDPVSPSSALSQYYR